MEQQNAKHQNLTLKDEENKMEESKLKEMNDPELM